LIPARRMGAAASTRRDYVQIFKGFHRFLRARKAIGIEAAFGCGWSDPSMSSTPPGTSARPPGGVAGVAGRRVTR
jgi:hypothetical protein